MLAATMRFTLFSCPYRRIRSERIRGARLLGRAPLLAILAEIALKNSFGRTRNSIYAREALLSFQEYVGRIHGPSRNRSLFRLWWMSDPRRWFAPHRLHGRRHTSPCCGVSSALGELVMIKVGKALKSDISLCSSALFPASIPVRTSTESSPFCFAPRMSCLMLSPTQRMRRWS